MASCNQPAREASARSPNLERAEAEVDGAHAQRLTTYGSYLPSLDFDYGFAKSSSARLDATGQGLTNTSYTSQLTATYDIFSGLRRTFNLKSYQRRVAAADSRYHSQRFQTILHARTAYFEAVANRELAGVESARAAFFPSFNFEGGWAWQNSEFPPNNRNWRFSVFGTMRLFNGFQRENQTWQARSRADAANAARRAAELQLREDVSTAYDQVEAARASIELAEIAVQLSREELGASRERFRFGRGSILELQEAQISLEQAEVDLVRSRFDRQIGIARLDYLLGAELPRGPASAAVDLGLVAPGDG